MGVPTFFKWLSVRYPRVLFDAIEPSSTLTEGGVFVPPDPSIILEPNPNGEVDNLYLDMNGIIHPCCHPEGVEPPETEEEMFQAIFMYIDRLMLVLRPRRLLFMAIDGVAPRAKMNQQRMRRFKAAQEAAQAEEVWQELVAEAETAGTSIPMKKIHWDHNVITPGTPFFARLSNALRKYIFERQASHPGWKDLRVIFSNAAVPGEGEHKIMNFIRNQRHYNGYDPNTRHCLCGADADLIMLGLATHEVHFSIIREQVLDPSEQPHSKPCLLCGTLGHRVTDCPHAAAENKVSLDANDDTKPSLESHCKPSLDAQRYGWKPLTILRLTTLREYLTEEFAFRAHLAKHGIPVPLSPWVANNSSSMTQQHELPPGKYGGSVYNYLEISETDPEAEVKRKRAYNMALDRLRDSGVFAPDLERCIDDFIIMCFFVGNDFLPHLPSLSIHRGSIDQMIFLYQQIRPILPDYLCDAGRLNLTAIRAFAEHLGEVEGEVFRADLRRIQMLKKRDQEQKQSCEQAAKLLRRRHSEPPRTHSEPSTVGPPFESDDANFAALAVLKKSLFAKPEQESQQPTEISETIGPESVDVRPPDDVWQDPLIETCSSSEGEEHPPLLPVKLSHVQELDLFKEKYRQKMKELNEKTDVQDEVQLGEGDTRDWRLRYYALKFDKSLLESNAIEYERLSSEICYRYAEGLQWVALYYFCGVQSWGWYYPYHYAPLASDLARHGFNRKFEFEMGDPFTPFQQLLAVLPARSSHCLPTPLARLMLDSNSCIKDFYPTKFREDPDGKRFRWQWVIQLPFINHKRLIRAVNNALRDNSKEIDASVLSQNELGSDELFLPRAAFQQHYGDTAIAASGADRKVKLNIIVERFGGEIQHIPHESTNAANSSSVVVRFLTHRPVYEETPRKHQPHPSALLPGAQLPPSSLRPGDGTPVDAGRRFNSGAARRMILASLDRRCVLGKQHVNELFQQMRNEGGSFRGPRSFHEMRYQGGDNRYEAEMFGHSSRRSDAADRSDEHSELVGYKKRGQNAIEGFAQQQQQPTDTPVVETYYDGDNNDFGKRQRR